ncbi:MAG: glycoside hydrolase family 15 protein [Planctomycetota bacterium]
MKFGIIGNCGYSALLDAGSVRWLCWPRMDSSFLFGGLLDEARGGSFDIEAVDLTSSRQEYVENTNILRTVFTSPTGSFELIDFAPRFVLYDRSFKPSMLVRILRPLEGAPLVRARCRPVGGYHLDKVSSFVASNHIEYTGLDAPVRLTTNVPLTYMVDERPFVLLGDQHLVLTWGQPLESALEETAERFLNRTTDYWRRWVKNARIPRDYQAEVIRSALVLKLHQFEDTGAIIAATTTSLPEFPGSGRCWDYRYCWLRDAYFSLNAFERLGHAEEMERFLQFLLTICASHGDRLQPLYGINGETELHEHILEHLDGYRGEKPVRIGNQAYEHVQNDVYGEMILAISRILMDTRFAGSEGIEGAQGLVHRLLQQIEQRLTEPDAGLWELRNQQQLHSFTLLMHWAGAARAADIGEALGSADLEHRGRKAAATARDILEERCWHQGLGALTQAADRDNLDAAMLLAVQLGFFASDPDRARSHVEAVRTGLSVDGGLLRRYDVRDDFGHQEAAFTVCAFWLVEAMAMVGRRDEACELFEQLLSLGNGLGLYSEDILPDTREQTGNFPQTYSHVGLINAAFRLSRDWS